MFVFKPTTKTYSDPAAATFMPGIPFGPEYSKGDICFLHEEFMGSKMYFNSKVLRQAVLDSKEYLEEVLEIKIADARETEEVVEEESTNENVETTVEETEVPTVPETPVEGKEESTDAEAPVDEATEPVDNAEETPVDGTEVAEAVENDAVDAADELPEGAFDAEDLSEPTEKKSSKKK